MPNDDDEVFFRNTDESSILKELESDYNFVVVVFFIR